MLTFHTHTLTFLSSYDISSHPKMIRLITGFIVSRATQFINWLCTNTDSLSMVSAAKKMQNTVVIHTCLREKESEGEREQIIVLTFKVSGACSCGCEVYLHVYFCMSLILRIL